MNDFPSIRWWPVVACGLMLAACSGGPPPRGEISQAQLAVQQAGTQSKASDYAPLQLQKAREKLDKAQQAVDDDEYEMARRYAEEALVDAQLAQAKAEAASTEQAARDMQASIETLRQEVQRGIDARNATDNASGPGGQNGTGGAP